MLAFALVGATAGAGAGVAPAAIDDVGGATAAAAISAVAGTVVVAAAAAVPLDDMSKNHHDEPQDVSRGGKMGWGREGGRYKLEASELNGNLWCRLSSLLVMSFRLRSARTVTVRTGAPTSRQLWKYGRRHGTKFPTNMPNPFNTYGVPP